MAGPDGIAFARFPTDDIEAFIRGVLFPLLCRKVAMKEVKTSPLCIIAGIRRTVSWTP
jgi:hypothetical protein